MGLFGLATGVAIGLVESALKDRWLYVSSGPLAGKQFVLYKQATTLGSSAQSDIYLFKDSSIQPEHARVEIRSGRVWLTASGPVLRNGKPMRDGVLTSGDYIQIGRYGFDYRDRERAV
jgi:predicted component of type VI protein secretion system